MDEVIPIDSLPVSKSARRLTPHEKRQFQDWGYVKDLPAFDAAAVPALQKRYHELAALLPDDVDMNMVNNWHKANRWVHDLCRTPVLLDYVEDIIGPNFFQWGGQFFIKNPGDESIVPWHQDAQYRPLTPHKTVTVWLAIYDADEQNGAMRVVRGSHRSGDIAHHEVNDARYVLDQEIDGRTIDEDHVVSLNLEAGDVSLHDDGLVHGSPANHTDRMWAALTMRFSPTDVRCDLGVWPTFEIMMARGIDEYGHNPAAKVPTGDGFPVRRFQPSSDFA